MTTSTRRARQTSTAKGLQPPPSIDVTKDPYDAIKHITTSCTYADHANKKNCRTNPWCVYGLGEKKVGIWKTPATAITRLGQDPELSLRPKTSNGNTKRTSSKSGSSSSCSNVTYDIPSGLKNLGATCYMNVLIQCLYNNLFIRDAIHNINASDNGCSTDVHCGLIIQEMQRLFTFMEHSPCKYRSLENLLQLLQLNAGEQQDAQEFNKLFLAKIEEFPMINNRDSNLLPICKLLSGIESFTTECCVCHYTSVRSYPFREIDLSIQGHSAVTNALSDYFSVESLSGDNQYYCDRCDMKRNATRKTSVTSNPVVLFLHLLRYYFDKKTFEKKKSKANIDIPSSIHLNEEEYVLVTVLYHIGDSAYGGHYVCDSLDWKTGKWWFYNDHTVLATDNPGHASDDANADIDTASADDKGKGGKRKKTIDEKKKVTPVKKSSFWGGLIRSKDAYMLAYVKKTDLQSRSRINRQLISNGYLEEVGIKIDEYNREVYHYSTTYDSLIAQINERKALYQSVKHVLSPTNSAASGEFHIVPSTWLQAYITGDAATGGKSTSIDTTCTITGSSDDATDSEIAMDVIDVVNLTGDANDDNRGSSSSSSSVCDIGIYSKSIANLPNLCKHGRGLEPLMVPRMKIISKEAYDILGIKDMIDHDINHTNYTCHECSNQITESNRSLNDRMTAYSSIESSIRHDINACNGSSIPPTDGMYIAKVWVTAFSKYLESMRRMTQRINDCVADAAASSDSSSSRIDVCINTALLCPHNNLKPKSKSRASLVSHGVWMALHVLFPQAVALSADAEYCAVCMDNDANNSERMVEEKNRRFEETSDASMRKLATRGKDMYPSVLNQERYLQNPVAANGSSGEGVDSYMAIDSEWLQCWRDYVSDYTCSRPDVLTNNRLRCCHNCSILPYSYWAMTVGVVPSSVPSDLTEMDVLPAVEIITKGQWDALRSFYTTVDAGAHTGTDTDMSAADAGAHTGTVPSAFEVSLAYNAINSKWVWTPAICDICIASMKASGLLARTSYANRSINVIMLPFDSMVPSFATVNEWITSQAAASASSEFAARASRRRDGNAKKPVAVTVSSSDSLNRLKLLISQELTIDVDPSQMNLYHKGVALDDYSNTVQDYGILAGEAVYLKVNKSNSSGGYDGYFNAFDDNGTRLLEYGFTGTFLSSSIISTGNASTAEIVSVAAVAEAAVTTDDANYDDKRIVKKSKK